MTLNMKTGFAVIVAAALASAASAQETTSTTSPDATEPTASAPAAGQAAAQTATGAPAQEPTPTLANVMPVAAPCELHIWPAERMSAQTSGWLSGLGLLGALADQAANSGKDANNRSNMASALDSPTQLDALLELDLPALLKRQTGTVLVRHEEPLDRKTMNKVKSRRSDSAAECYSELIVADVAYQKSPIYGRSLRTLFMVRDFGKDQKIDFQYKAWGGNGLKLFPAKEGEDSVAALDELVGVFKLNFEEYANNARKSMATKKRR